MEMVLIITNKQDITSDFIVKELKSQKIEFYRFNTEELNHTCFVDLDIAGGRHTLFDRELKMEFDLKQFTSVYFRRPALPTINTEGLSQGEIQFLKNENAYTLEGIYKILKDAYWVSPLFSIREAENKIYQLELAKEIGFKIPQSTITNSFESATEFYDHNKESCIVKPIKSGLIDDAVKPQVVFTNALTSRPSSREQIESSPIFLQNHISKKFDVRVTVVGASIFATLINSQNSSQTKVDWRSGEKALQHTKVELPNDLKDQCMRLMKELNLRFGAIDFILDEHDEYIFLEINPNGQWAWIERRTGYPISKAIVKLLDERNF